MQEAMLVAAILLTGTIIAWIALRVSVFQVVGLRLTRISLRVRAVDGRSVRLPANKYTEQVGTYGARWDGMSGHARIGGEITTTGTGLTRSIERCLGPALERGARIDWSGQYYTDAADLGLPHSDVHLEGIAGAAPAWHFPPAIDGDGVWVIHIHGLRVTRLSPLRGVPAVHAAGAHSLVISYRGDKEGPAQSVGGSTLGQTEWQDVEPAVDYAIAHGATRVVLLGWSMGGTMAPIAGAHPSLRGRVDDLVLVGPVTDWRRVIQHGAREARVPTWVARVVLGCLSRRRLARLVGFGAAIDFDGLDWTRPGRSIEHPCMILHTAADDEVPFQLTQAVCARNPHVRLVELPPALHTLEWNRSPEEFESAITRWILEPGPLASRR